MKLKSIIFAVCLALCGAVFASDAVLINSQHSYVFPTDSSTPFESWNIHNAGDANKDAAEFAAMFASKVMTIVSSVEDTKTGKRAYVIVADQKCILDFIKLDNQWRASKIDCSKKSFKRR